MEENKNLENSNKNNSDTVETDIKNANDSKSTNASENTNVTKSAVEIKGTDISEKADAEDSSAAGKADVPEAASDAVSSETSEAASDAVSSETSETASDAVSSETSETASDTDSNETSEAASDTVNNETSETASDTDSAGTSETDIESSDELEIIDLDKDDDTEEVEEAEKVSRKRKSRKRFFNIIRYIAMAVMAAVVVYEGYMLVTKYLENDKAKKEYESIEKTYVTVKESSSAAEDEEAYPDLEIDHEGLYKENNDYIGWLYFPAVKMSYPAVQERKINEYIVKTFEGSMNGNGAVFMDILSDPSFMGMSNFLFAHNMRNRSMFGILPTLAEEGNKELLEKDPYFYVYTKKAVFRYRVFAYYTCMPGGEVYVEVGEDAEKYDEIINYINENNLYDCPVKYDFSLRQELLHLSTCTDTGAERFIVSGIKDKVWYLTDDAKTLAEDRYAAIRKEFVEEIKSKDGDTELKIDFEGLKKINEDLAGWLYVPGVGISYPIAIEKGTGDYIKTTFYKEKDNAGSIYVDVDSDKNFNGYSNMIFGHYRSDGTMFGSLMDIVNNEKYDFKGDPYFYIYKEDKVLKYKIFAYWRGSFSGDITLIVNENGEGLDRVLSYIDSMNIYENKDTEDQSGIGLPRILTLVSNADLANNERLFISGMLVEE